jgi:hypothetical protein
MSISLRLLAFGAAFAIAGTAFAAAPQAPTATKARTPQQQRMADCNKQATGKKGDERKAFMSSCLKGKTSAVPATHTARQAQQEKMKSCNAEAKAKALTGAERKTFISGCLKGTDAKPA